MYFDRKEPSNKKLSDFVKSSKAGGTPKTSNSSYYNGNIPFLSITDITNQGKYIESTKITISENGLKNSSAWLVPENSLILSMFASVGLPTINRVPLATSQAMISMILKTNENLDYLYYYLKYFKENRIHRYLEKGTQNNINSNIVKNIPVVDYNDENVIIGSRLSIIDNCIEYEKNNLNQTLIIKNKLMRELFK